MVLHQSYVRCNMLSAWTARNQVGPMAFPVLRVRREDGDGRERYQSVSDQSCRNRGSRVQFCPGRVDCRSCLALAAQVNGGKTRARLLWAGHFLCHRRPYSMLRDENTKGRCTLGRRGWPWLGALAGQFHLSVTPCGSPIPAISSTGRPPHTSLGISFARLRTECGL